MSQEVVDRDLPADDRHLEPRQGVDDRHVEVEPALLDELEDGDRRERLADRADLEKRVRLDRAAGGEVGEPVGPDLWGAV